MRRFVITLLSDEMRGADCPSRSAACLYVPEGRIFVVPSFDVPAFFSLFPLPFVLVSLPRLHQVSLQQPALAD